MSGQDIKYTMLAINAIFDNLATLFGGSLGNRLNLVQPATQQLLSLNFMEESDDQEGKCDRKE